VNTDWFATADLRPATADDFEFSHELTRRNMESYVVRHFGPWSRDVYTENFRKGRNYILWSGDTRVGYVRLLLQPPILFIDDFQIAVSYQGRGLGASILQHLHQMLPRCSCKSIRLRVYHENPARRLYLRMGFCEIERNEGTSILQRDW
jgi:ribosomal protein S18 acetylase RimI-like enzyme